MGGVFRKEKTKSWQKIETEHIKLRPHKRRDYSCLCSDILKVPPPPPPPHFSLHTDNTNARNMLEMWSFLHHTRTFIIILRLIQTDRKKKALQSDFRFTPLCGCTACYQSSRCVFVWVCKCVYVNMCVFTQSNKDLYCGWTRRATGTQREHQTAAASL